MPAAAYVAVEQVPADRLARVGGDGRRVADECAAVETERLLAAATGEHYVLVAAGVGPDDLGSGRDSHVRRIEQVVFDRDRKSTRLNSSHVAISYAVFCLKKKKK